MTYEIGLDEAGCSFCVEGAFPLRRRRLQLLDLLHVLPYTSQLSEDGVRLGVDAVQAQRRCTAS